MRHFDAEESPIPEAKCPVPEQVSTTFARQQERIPQASHQSPPRATTTFGRPAENIAAGEPSSDLLDLDVQTSETPAALQKQNSIERRTRAERLSASKTQDGKAKPPMEMIDNSLTIDIESDMLARTGKVPAYVNRPFTSSGHAKITPVKETSAKSRPAKSAAKATSSSIEMKLKTDFGITLGNKLFRNEEFERKIAEVQR